MSAFASYIFRGQPGIGLVEGDQLAPLPEVRDLGRGTTIAQLNSAIPDRAHPIALADVRLLPVIPNPGKVFCVGLNYLDHILETKREMPTYPVLFPKFASSLLGANEPIILPPESEQVDYEGELAVVIGLEGRRIALEDALQHVLGYTVANDVSMRDYQYKTHQWLQGKAWDNCTPLGPFLVEPRGLDIAASGIKTTLNGRTVQESDLSQLIFTVATLISTVSVFTKLVPGDVILTGTPGGVGFRRTPKLFLHGGDTVSVHIDGVGTLTNDVVAAAS